MFQATLVIIEEPDTLLIEEILHEFSSKIIVYSFPQICNWSVSAVFRISVTMSIYSSHSPPWLETGSLV